MKLNKIKVLLVATVLFTGIGAQGGNVGGNGAGNGGDYLRFIFEEGRDKALSLIQELRPCAIPKHVPNEVRNWVLSHQQDLVLDLQNTKFEWSVDSNHVCAFTRPTRSAPIDLSYEACRPTIKDKNAAARLLIHEITHHFGITNEDFADWVSYAISNSKESDSCTGGGSNDVFSSRYCSSENMSAGQAIRRLDGMTEKTLGSFEITTRVRRCPTVGGCGEWRISTEPPALMFYGFNGERRSEDRSRLATFDAKPVKGEIALMLKNDHPYLLLTSVTDRLNAWYYSEMMYYLYNLTFHTEIQGHSMNEPLYANCLKNGSQPSSINGDCNFGASRPRYQEASIAALPGKTFQGRLGKDCLWLFQNARTNNVDSNGNTSALEYEVVIHGKF